MGKMTPPFFFSYGVRPFGRGTQPYIVFRELTKGTNHGYYPLTTPVVKVDGSISEKVDEFLGPRQTKTNGSEPPSILSRWYTLQGTNISPKNGILKMIFLFPRWDMLIS